MMNKLSSKKVAEIAVEFGEFEIGQVMGGSNSVYLRFGYWRRVNLEKLQAMLGGGFTVVEDDDFDDDCGWLYSYKLK
jgi:hypothetical protein